jgi:hypothetical protein
MYINIPENGYHSGECFVVRIYKADETSWVGNFGFGFGGISDVYDFPSHNRLVVFSRGEGYIIDPEKECKLDNFETYVHSIIKLANGDLICATPCEIIILQNDKWKLWASDRISWDGIKDLKLDGSILSGITYDPTNSIEPWCPFTLNIETKEITGGSYRDMLDRNPHLREKLLG